MSEDSRRPPSDDPGTSEPSSSEPSAPKGSSQGSQEDDPAALIPSDAESTDEAESIPESMALSEGDPSAGQEAGSLHSPTTTPNQAASAPAPTDTPSTKTSPRAPDASVQIVGSADRKDPVVVVKQGDAMWGQATRGMALWSLLALALVTWARLGTGKEWLTKFLQRNALPMEDRNVFLLQLIAAAFLGALAAGAFLFFRRKDKNAPRTLERWGWFLSPAILLPATVVFGQHQAWQGRHEDLLPLVLFAALIAERLFTQSLANVPPFVQAVFGEEDAPPSKAGVVSWLRKHGFLTLVVGAALAYGAFMSFYVVRWHNQLGTATFDLGINNNLLYGGLDGKFNQSTVIFPEEPEKYVANHVKLGLYLFLPIYALFPDAKTLLIIQSLSLGLGAIPLFLFARKRVPEWIAGVIALCYLAYYPMHGANFYEMKMVPTAAAFVLTMIWAIDAKRWVVGGIFFVLALIMREDLPVPLAVIGIFLLLSGYRPKAGLVIGGVSVFWFVLIRFKVMTDAGAWWFPNMYEDLWSAPEKGFRSVLKTLLSNPTFTLEHIFVEKKFWYMMHLLVPLAFVPLRRWYLWAALVPGAILTLLVTDYDPPLMYSFQYVMHWSPYLFVAAALALAAIRHEDRQGSKRAAGAAIAMAIASLALTYNYGAFPTRDRALKAGYHKITFGWNERDEKKLTAVKEMVASIPQEASVATTERIGAHLSSRTHFYTLRRGVHGAEYIVARRRGLRLDNTRRSVRNALRNEEYGPVGRYGEFIVFKKGAPTDENQKILEDWGLVKKKRKRANQRRKARDRRRSSKNSDESKKSKEQSPSKDERDLSKGKDSRKDANEGRE